MSDGVWVADLYRLWVTGRVTLKEVSWHYDQARVGCGRVDGHIDDAFTGPRYAMGASWLRGIVNPFQEAMRRTADWTGAGGEALMSIAVHYGEEDESVAEYLNALIDDRNEELSAADHDWDG